MNIGRDTPVDPWLPPRNVRLLAGQHDRSSPAAPDSTQWRLSLQPTAFFTSAQILASSAAVSSFSAKPVGHVWPSSRFALSLKPSVAYLVLNICVL
jgi:hypothetical protein